MNICSICSRSAAFLRGGSSTERKFDNPQPFSGWWTLPDGTTLRIKQWGKELRGQTQDASKELSGAVDGGSAQLSIGGGAAKKLQMGGDCGAMSVDGAPAERHVPKLVIVCGPSGVGKGTLVNRMMKEFPDQFGFSCSHTTRDPRPGEVDGKSYHFRPKAEVQAGIDRGEFVEYAHVHGNIYGTSKKAVQDVLDAGKVCILDIDIQGAQKVRAAGIPFVSIFVKPPSWEELEKRLRGRGTETEEKIQKRLTGARGEVEFCDSHSFFWYELVNDDLEQAYKDFVSCISQSMELGKKSNVPQVAWSANPSKTQITG